MIKPRTPFRCCGSEDQLSRNGEVAPQPKHHVPSLQHGMEAASHFEDVEDRAPLRGHPPRTSGTSLLDVEEIKATIMEHRMNDPVYQQAATMKSVTNLTLAELKTKADGLGIQYPEKITKGNLLRLIRDAVSTPGSELMKIGKYKGYEFQEIPHQYGMWTAREIRMSRNPHVELVRFAKWWEEKEYQKHLRKRGLLRSQCDGALSGGRDEQIGDFGIKRMGAGLYDDSECCGPGSADRPEGEQTRSIVGRLRPGGDERHGVRDRPGHPRGDPRARDQACDVEAEGEGGTAGAQGEQVIEGSKLTVGNLAR